MSLREKIEIDGLSHARLAKIRGNVFRRLDDERLAQTVSDEFPTVRGRRLRTRWGPWVGAFAVAATALLVFGLQRFWPARVEIAETNPSRVVTGSAESHLALGESSVDVAPGSALLASGDDEHGILLVLERGSVSCEVAPRHGRPAFVVQAGSVRVRVVGTRFTVERVDESARVEVVHGTVEVSSAGGRFLVSDGQRWPARAATGAAASSGIPEVPIDSLAVVKRERPAARQGANVSTSGTPSTPNPAPSTASSDTAEESSPPTTVPQADRPDPQELFEQAAASEKRDPARAASIYRDLTSTSGPWAANALFAQGRLEADLGHVADARLTLRAYLSRYPQGRNAADARALLDRLH